MSQHLGSYLVPAFALVGAVIPLVSAFFFPHWRMTYGRGGKVPISVRGKIAMGLYFAYFGLLIFVGSNRILQGAFCVGWAVLMVAFYPIYLRDRRDYENSTPEK
jgi:hypothetical protein